MMIGERWELQSHLVTGSVEPFYKQRLLKYSLLRVTSAAISHFTSVEEKGQSKQCIQQFISRNEHGLLNVGLGQ
jgi:hypothetical protein